MENPIKVSPLSASQIAELDTASAQRLMGEIDIALSKLTDELLEASNEFFVAKSRLSNAKMQKEFLVERARNLKNFIRNT